MISKLHSSNEEYVLKFPKQRNLRMKLEYKILNCVLFSEAEHLEIYSQYTKKDIFKYGFNFRFVFSAAHFEYLF